MSQKTQRSHQATQRFFIAPRNRIKPQQATFNIQTCNQS